eukprot:1157053-Pelagomonas_calceolata.AAC.3
MEFWRASEDCLQSLNLQLCLGLLDARPGREHNLTSITAPVDAIEICDDFAVFSRRISWISLIVTSPRHYNDMKEGTVIERLGRTQSQDHVLANDHNTSFLSLPALWWKTLTSQNRRRPYGPPSS